MKNQILFLLICFLFSCQESNVKKINDQELRIGNISYKIYEWEFKNHIYIIIDSKNPTVTHAGHCPCLKNQIK